VVEEKKAEEPAAGAEAEKPATDAEMKDEAMPDLDDKPAAE